MQCILTDNDFVAVIDQASCSEVGLREIRIHDQNENIRAVSFSCPYCAEMGFSAQCLMEHLRASHANNEEVVVCPMCAASRADCRHEIGDLAAHIARSHVGPAICTAFKNTEIQARVRRSKQTARRGDSAHATGTNAAPGSFLAAARMDENMETINELISQLSDPSHLANGGAGGDGFVPPTGGFLSTGAGQTRRRPMPLAVPPNPPLRETRDDQIR